MHLAWLTDIHLDFVPDGGTSLWGEVAAAHPDAVLLTGDIAVAATLRRTLEEAADVIKKPIYFVLGNHDFYGSTINAVRENMRQMTRTSPYLRWLPAAGVVTLGEGLALVGHDGWADARLGDVQGSKIELNDWSMIGDLTGLSPSDRIQLLRQLGDEAAQYLRKVLVQKASAHEQIIVLSHPPPLAMACRYYGFRSPDVWLPHLACAAAGEVLLDVADSFSQCRFTVLCGHTHGRALVRARPNLEVRCGSATYRKPKLQRLVTPI